MKRLGWPSERAYLDRLMDAHDFEIDAEILSMEERLIGQLRVLDGQVNLQSDPVRRTCSLTISDPDGALDFSTAASYSGTSLWANRMIRVHHTLTVSGDDVTATPFVGPVMTLARAGAEVNVVCHDKMALAIRGSKPYRVRKGMHATTAIRNIFRDCVGERHFRLPNSRRRLSRDYAVGWDDKASPYAIAHKIARHELGMELLYACDGYLLLRQRPTAACIKLPYVLDQASDNVDFTTVDNWVRVTGKTSSQSSSKKRVTIKTTPVTTAILPARDPLSPVSLGRNGALRYMPLLVTDDAYTQTSQTKHRADVELDRHGRIKSNPQVNCTPIFHLDSDDLIRVPSPDGSRTVRLTTASIPLGVGGAMTIGTQQWVSQPPSIHSRSRKIRQVHHWKKPKRHHKKVR